MKTTFTKENQVYREIHLNVHSSTANLVVSPLIAFPVVTSIWRAMKGITAHKLMSSGVLTKLTSLMYSTSHSSSNNFVKHGD